MKKILFISLLFFYGCSNSYTITVEEGGTKILTGICNRQILISESDFNLWYDTYYENHHIEDSVLSEIATERDNISFVIFLGTWCGDSKRQVPAFFKILDSAGFSQEKIFMYGLDRSKRSDDGVTEQYNITNVPTFVILRNEQEIGRIVEFPQETLERDLAGILKRR